METEGSQRLDAGKPTVGRRCLWVKHGEACGEQAVRVVTFRGDESVPMCAACAVEAQQVAQSFGTTVHVAPLAIVACLLFALGCRPPPQPVPKPSPTEDARLSACLNLRDHIVDLYVDEYLTTSHTELSPIDREAFTVGWREELAKRGSFDRFEQTCFAGLTMVQYACGMSATDTDGIVACMR